jgi:hypothetical protein
MKGKDMAAPVKREQFVVTAEGITHVPTGATFTPHPGRPDSDSLYHEQLGNVLKNGEDHRPEEVRTMMQQMWQEYVAENPDLFANEHGTRLE